MRACLRTPGEVEPQPVACLLTLLPVPITRVPILGVSRQVIHHGHPDLIAGQELGAPPSQCVPGPLARQGHALAVGERQDAASSALGTPGGQDLLGGRHRRRALGLGTPDGTRHAGPCRDGQQHRGRVRLAVPPTRSASSAAPATTPSGPAGAPGALGSPGRHHQVAGAPAQLEHAASQPQERPLPQPHLPASTQPQPQVPVAVGAVGRSAVLRQDMAAMKPQAQMTA